MFRSLDARSFLPVCLLLAVGLAPATLAEATLDIRPASCPNLLDRQARSLVPVAIVGDFDFPPIRIVRSSLTLSRADGVGESVTPFISGRRTEPRAIDVTAPSPNGMCSTFGVDGIRDLRMFFGQQEMVSSMELDSVPENSTVELCISGELRYGGSFSACDVVTVSGLGIVVTDDGARDLPRSRR